jgi:hypothetical protein
MVTTIEKWRPAFLFENESGGAESANLLRQSGYVIGAVNLSGEFVEGTSGGNLFAFPRERMPKSLPIELGIIENSNNCIRFRTM